VDGELLQKDGNIMKKVEEIRLEWDNMKDFMEGTFKELNMLDSRKEFALASLKFPFHKFLFAIKDEKNLRDIRLTYEELIKWRDSLPTKKEIDE
jgi:hypothetical protein